MYNLSVYRCFVSTIDKMSVNLFFIYSSDIYYLNRYILSSDE